MTKHYELIKSIPWTQLIVTQWVGDGYIYNKMVNFHILKRDRTKEISFVNFSLPFLSGPGNKYQNQWNRNLWDVYHPKKIADKVLLTG
jgi:hypothetical protein